MSEVFTFFWKPDSVFAQWHKSKFIMDGIEYNCAEQYMMYQKAILFGDKETAKEIIQIDDPQKQKKLGRRIKGFCENKWDKNKERIVYEGNYAKFNQNHEMKKKLLKAKGTLVEASPYDKIWGIGLRESDPKSQRRETWQGLNLLGISLTKVRDKMLKEK